MFSSNTHFVIIHGQRTIKKTEVIRSYSGREEQTYKQTYYQNVDTSYSEFLHYHLFLSGVKNNFIRNFYLTRSLFVAATFFILSLVVNANSTNILEYRTNKLAQEIRAVLPEHEYTVSVKPFKDYAYINGDEQFGLSGHGWGNKWSSYLKNV